MVNDALIDGWRRASRNYCISGTRQIPLTEYTIHNELDQLVNLLAVSVSKLENGAGCR